MSVYSNIQIKESIKNGHIVCIPYTEDNVSEASLDITLGYYYYTISDSTNLVYNVFDKNQVDSIFKGPFKAEPLQNIKNSYGLSSQKNIPNDFPVILLKPNQRILAHTHEFFGIKPPGAYQLNCRSSWSRNGLTVTGDAGWVEPGYTNRLSMQIHNTNSSLSIILPVGERIAQAIFFDTGEVYKEYSQSRNGISGKYQNTNVQDEIIKSWEPSMILPKCYKDSRVLPNKIEGSVYE